MQHMEKHEYQYLNNLNAFRKVDKRYVFITRFHQVEYIEIFFYYLTTNIIHRNKNAM